MAIDGGTADGFLVGAERSEAEGAMEKIRQRSRRL